MFINTTTDILYRFSDVLGENNLCEINEDKEILLMGILDEVKHIVKYANECLNEIEKTCKCKIYKLTNGNLWLDTSKYV